VGLEKGDEEGFVRALLEGQPEAPTYFKEMKRLNRDGMPILGGIPHPGRLTKAQFDRLLAQGAVLVDTRDKFAFAGGHIPGSINIPAGKNFSTWAGWLLPYDRPLILLAHPSEVEALTRALIRIGLDEVVGYIPKLEGYAREELEIVPQITVKEAKELWESCRALILDVRAGTSTAPGTFPGPSTSTPGGCWPTWTACPRTGPSSSTAWAGTAPAPPSPPFSPTALRTP
jgi:hydroxyacylglutathione hydrolase